MNKSCYNATLPFIYRNLTIKVSSRASLRRDVEQLRENDLSQKRLEYLRHLKLQGQMPLLEKHTREELPLIRDVSDVCAEPDETSTNDSRVPQFHTVFAGDHDEAGPDESSHAWSPVVSLISSLSHLMDLIYECKNQFPPCLLQALHRHHPACRLDIRTFRFRSLRKPNTDPNELALVTSPCLHSLSVRYITRDEDGNDDYNEEAVMRAVASTPNLKHVNMLGCSAADSPGLYFSEDIARVPWKGFIPPLEKFQIRSLISLAFYGYHDITKEKMDVWSRYTDLSKIQSLIVSDVSDATIFIDSAGDALFKSLKHLNIHFQREHDDLTFTSGVLAFFWSLSSLTTLSLRGSLNWSLILKILERHGLTLKELKVLACEDLIHTDILSIRHSCPLLATLQLTIKRFKSSWHETQCYEALGTLSSLTKLTIHLDCSTPWRRNPPSGDEDDFHRQLYKTGLISPVYNSHVRDALINSAIDESLAREIWEIISKDKPGRPLASLRIASSGGAIFAGPCLDTVSERIRHMSRSFLHTRSERDDSDHVEIVELGKEMRERNDQLRRDGELERLKRRGYSFLDKNLDGITQRLWPPKPGSLDWRDDWCSWPLEKVPQNFV